ncbi:MAG: NADH:ubiquinone reductase (Na(+)-transporting) subunit C [Planctomycetes bacterium]|nr:NADH:ubiquinone reductase (Na(+)-transporting) subunit C [Planctomycetota bacterium]
MNINSNGYVLGFAVGVCVVISAALAVTANALKPAQDAAAEFDRQKNVMIACGLIQEGDPRPRKELEELFRKRVVEKVIDIRTGEVDQAKTPADLAAMRSPADRARYRAVAVAKDEQGKEDTFILPISGRGLWSTLYGYLALEHDANRVRGITFYKHGETPGLGGEVDNPNWKAQWRGKSILDEKNQLVSVTVKKGKVDPAIAREKEHMVDGLSGATITCNGVNKFVRSDLEAFRPYLSRYWTKKD